MTKSELRTMIKEMLKEELEASGALLKEDEQKPLRGYVVKAWDTPDKNGAGMIDTAKKGVAYATFEDLIKALQTDELDEKGAYEITWVK
jgi:hypothetical protein